MTPDPDEDLRAAFAQLRREEHRQAPAWHLPRPATVQPLPWLLQPWLPATAFVILCLAAALLWLSPTSSPDLVEALPGLFDDPLEPLFAHLDLRSSAPTDFLLPPHLSIQLP